MKIILTSPYNRKHQAQYFYIKAIKELGHEVRVFWYNKLIGRVRLPNNKLTRPIIRIINNIFIKLIINDFHPDILIHNTGADIFTPETIKHIKKNNCKTALITGDSPINLLNTDYEKKYLPYFDAVFTSSISHVKEWKSIGAKEAYNLPCFGIDSDFHQLQKLSKEEKRKYCADVSFFGSFYKQRQEKLKSMIKHLPSDLNIKLWGYVYDDAPLDEFLKPYYFGNAWERESVKITSASKISVNLVHDSQESGGNIRTFEIPASKSLQLINNTDSSWFKIGKEIITFNSSKDAAEKIVFFLEHPKKLEKISEAGYKRVHKDHTYKKRFEKLIKLIN